MAVEFTDNRLKIKEMLDEALIAYLYEAGGELEARAIRNSRTDTGQTKGSYRYVVNESKGECQIGSGHENAIWEEFGTGEYALNGKGRKGGWVYKNPKATLNKDGKPRKNSKYAGYVFTLGKKPNRPMQRAFDTCKNKLIKRYSEILKEKFGR